MVVIDEGRAPCPKQTWPFNVCKHAPVGRALTWPWLASVSEEMSILACIDRVMNGI